MLPSSGMWAAGAKVLRAGGSLGLLTPLFLRMSALRSRRSVYEATASCKVTGAITFQGLVRVFG